MQGAAIFFEIILLLAALPAIALSRRGAVGWRSGAVFAAVYPAIVLALSAAMALVLLLIAPLGLVAFS